MRQLGSWIACVALGAALLAAGCNKDAPPAEAPPATVAPAPVAAADTVPAPDTAAPPASDTSAAAAAPRPEEIARLAVLAAQIDCAAEAVADPIAREKAIDAVLTRAGMSLDQYYEQAGKLVDDKTFQTTREQSAALCRTPPAAEPGEPPAADAEASLREKIKSLAVAGECMRRAGATSDEVAPAMLALYRANGLDLETYSREMTRLSTTASFLQEVEEATRACPVAEVVADAGDGGDVPGDGGDVPGDGGDVPSDVPGSPVEVVEPPGETGGTPEVTPTPVVLPIRGVYNGSMGKRDRIRISVSANGNIDPANATIGGKRYRLRGRVDKHDAVHMAANAGRDWLQMTGRLDRKRKSISGTWNGVIDSKRQSGSFSARR